MGSASLGGQYQLGDLVGWSIHQPLEYRITLPLDDITGLRNRFQGSVILTNPLFNFVVLSTRHSCSANLFTSGTHRVTNRPEREVKPEREVVVFLGDLRLSTQRCPSNEGYLFFRRDLLVVPLIQPRRNINAYVIRKEHGIVFEKVCKISKTSSHFIRFELFHFVLPSLLFIGF